VQRYVIYEGVEVLFARELFDFFRVLTKFIGDFRFLYIHYDNVLSIETTD